MVCPDTLGPVKSELELQNLVNELRTKSDGSLLLYRGETDVHETLRSGRARPSARIVPEVERGWHSLVGRLLNPKDDANSGMTKRSAILQHYGMATHFLDLTDDAVIAAWFACNRYTPLPPSMWVGNNLRHVECVKYRAIADGLGSVVVLSIPKSHTLIRDEKLIPLGDLTSFLRPSRQSAWLFYDRPPLLPDPNSFWHWTIQIDRSVFRSSQTQSVLFPSPSRDEGYDGLLSVPYVQIPSPYLGPEPERKPEDSDESYSNRVELMKHLCFASRALSISEMVEDGRDAIVDHKYDDITLYEPLPVRMWKWWHFDLGKLHTGLSGDISKAAKVTVAPWAWEAMNDAIHDGQFEWPELENNDLFFSLAAVDHDKVIDHGPPYHGTWLHRDGDLIVEQGMVADKDLDVTAGHAFLLHKNKLNIQQTRHSCTCESPEQHYRTVSAILSMSNLVRKGVLALLPHPFWIPDWYVLL